MADKKLASKLLATALFTGLALASANSHAALINSVLTFGTNEIQDSDAERVLRGGSVVTSGSFQVGDVIQSIVSYDTINGTGINHLLNVNGGPLPNSYDITGYSELRIDAINPASGGNVQLVFGPTGNLSNANSMVDIYERTSSGQPAFSLTAAPSTGISNVTSQTLIASLGMGKASDYWLSTAPNNIATIANAPKGSGQAPAGIFGISVLSNPGHLPIAPNGMLSPVDGKYHDVVGDASVYSREVGVNPGWLVSSNTNAVFSVPEPGTLALLGTGMLGLGFTSMRRKG